MALAQVLVPKGEHEEALDAVTKAKPLDPQNPQIYDRWGGQALFHLGRFEDAAVTLRQVVELDPEDLWSHMWLAVAYAELGRDDEGWEEIVQLNAMRKERLGSAPISLKIVTAFEFDRPEDALRLRRSLRLIGVTVAAAPPTRPRDRLKGEELRAFSRIPWWYGGDPGEGTEFWIFFNSPGELIHGAFVMTGVGRSLGIENDQICNEYAGETMCLDLPQPRGHAGEQRRVHPSGRLAHFLLFRL